MQCAIFFSPMHSRSRGGRKARPTLKKLKQNYPTELFLPKYESRAKPPLNAMAPPPGAALVLSREIAS